MGIGLDGNYKKINAAPLVPIIEGRENVDRVAFCETGGLGGPHPSPHSLNVKSIRSRKWKLIYKTTAKKNELYDLENDPRGESNCVDKYQDTVSMLWNEL